MSEMFEEDDTEAVELPGDFEEVDVDIESVNVPDGLMDARRRLEKVLDEKRLQEELEDFGDF